MDIKVLGMGCAKCTKLYANVEEALKSAGKEATLGKVDSLEDIMKYGVMSTPALVIDEKVVSAGKLASVSEIEAFFS